MRRQRAQRLSRQCLKIGSFAIIFIILEAFARTDGHSAHKIAKADGEAAAKNHVAGGDISRYNSHAVVAVRHAGAIKRRVFADENERHDDAEDGDSFAENNRDEILCANARRFDAAAKNRRARRKNAPINVCACLPPPPRVCLPASANNRKRQRTGDAEAGPPKNLII